jgi:hypothetical protein
MGERGYCRGRAIRLDRRRSKGLLRRSRDLRGAVMGCPGRRLLEKRRDLWTWKLRCDVPVPTWRIITSLSSML